MTSYESKPKIVIVDLDGTLIKTDSMIESIISVLKDNPFRIFFLISKLLKGKVDFKKFVFENCAFSSFAGTFPVNKELVDYLKEEKKNGAKLYLVSASDERAVKATAEALELSSFPKISLFFLHETISWLLILNHHLMLPFLAWYFAKR